MGLHELLHDREADPGPVRVATGGTTEESLEDPLLFPEGNSRPGVCHLEIGVGLSGANDEIDPTPGRGELRCVHEQVRHYLANPIRVSPDHGRRQGPLQVELFRTKTAGHRVRHTSRYRRQIDAMTLEA